MTKLRQAIDGLTRQLERAAGWMLAAMVVLVFGNVVLRYGFNSGIAVSEEWARYLFIWLTFIGAAIALREQAHLGVDSLVRILPRAGKRLCVVVSDLLMLGAVAMLMSGSWAQTLINKDTRSPVSEVPLALIYVAGLVSSALMGLWLLWHLGRVLRGSADDDELVLSKESEELAALEHAEHQAPMSLDRAGRPPGGQR